ncbi:MAG: UDP-glucose/GDP-mannose dehydrogenase family protein [Nitrospira sp.]|nr:MAG: UDP-glucose/GDP-mannose dehydrogenase family protein [Nitrospira sp.]
MGTRTIGVVGLWHLGCTIAASWAKMGHQVRAVDLDEGVVGKLAQGQPPIYEPGLEKAICDGMASGALLFSGSVKELGDCRFVFLAYDTPVREDDTSDLTIIHEVIGRIGPHLAPKTVVIVSAQLPVGTARDLRARLKSWETSLELVYSPENLRLGEALACYARPGHIVIGADDPHVAAEVESLFAPMQATCLKMNLPSAEMTKHGINSFLAVSITLANHWADLCAIVGADFSDVSAAMKHDPRIGMRAYLTAGIGFSGGTLGRDLRVLDQLNQDSAREAAPLFGEVWRYNQARSQVVRRRCQETIGSLNGRTIALLGITYKPGTSTLRRSLPLEVAEDLAKHGVCLRAYDPKADWSEATLPTGLSVYRSAYEAVTGADMAVLLTEWPEFLELDYSRMKAAMSSPILFDTKGLLKSRVIELEGMGFRILLIGRS